MSGSNTASQRKGDLSHNSILSTVQILFDSLRDPVEYGEQHAKMVLRIHIGRLDSRGSFRWGMEVCSWFTRFRVSIPATLPNVVSPRFDVVKRVIPSFEPSDIESC